ncbi:hypothetical protein H4R33_000849 [Dimargaris cristalligena]|nr:hypothetical protein H4R33_000849 [Dimargaris cristalligena]
MALISKYGQLVQTVSPNGRGIAGQLPETFPALLNSWLAQMDTSVKVLAVNGNDVSLEQLLKMKGLATLTPTGIFTSAMWAFWFKHPSTARLLMAKLDDYEDLPLALHKLKPHLIYWWDMQSLADRD